MLILIICLNLSLSRGRCCHHTHCYLGRCSPDGAFEKILPGPFAGLPCTCAGQPHASGHVRGSSLRMRGHCSVPYQDNYYV